MSRQNDARFEAGELLGKCMTEKMVPRDKWNNGNSIRGDLARNIKKERETEEERYDLREKKKRKKGVDRLSERD